MITDKKAMLIFSKRLMISDFSSNEQRLSQRLSSACFCWYFFRLLALSSF